MLLSGTCSLTFQVQIPCQVCLLFLEALWPHTCFLLTWRREQGTCPVLTASRMGLWSTRCPLTSSGHRCPTACPRLWLVPPGILGCCAPRAEVPGGWPSSVASLGPDLWLLPQACTPTRPAEIPGPTVVRGARATRNMTQRTSPTQRSTHYSSPGAASPSPANWGTLELQK